MKYVNATYSNTITAKIISPCKKSHKYIKFCLSFQYWRQSTKNGGWYTINVHSTYCNNVRKRSQDKWLSLERTLHCVTQFNTRTTKSNTPSLLEAKLVTGDCYTAKRLSEGWSQYKIHQERYAKIVRTILGYLLWCILYWLHHSDGILVETYSNLL